VRLHRLITRNFRNLDDVDIATNARVVVFCGDNAQGKTNTLEAIHVLATLKPLRNQRSRSLITWDCNEASVAGAIEHQGVQSHYRVDLSPQGRKYSIDGQAIAKFGDYFDGIRCIAFTPTHASILSGGPSLRRKWLDRAAFTAKPEHLTRVFGYQRCLTQKNMLLRSVHVDRGVLRALNQTLAKQAGVLALCRQSMLQELVPFIAAVHQNLSDAQESIELRYRTRCDGQDAKSYETMLFERLCEIEEDEIKKRVSLVGPHHDEVDVQINGRSARTYASQGQGRTLVLAMKLGELLAARQRGEEPLFLLDDLGSEMDESRTSRLLALLSELGTQVFITTTRPKIASMLGGDEVDEIEVLNGKLKNN